MPIFEYRCRSCEARFELIVQGHQEPTCPSCQATTLDKQLSVFAVTTRHSAARSSMPAGGCGGCCHADSCAMN